LGVPILILLDIVARHEGHSLEGIGRFLGVSDLVVRGLIQASDMQF